MNKIVRKFFSKDARDVLLNAKGVGLTQVTIAAGMMGVVSLGVMQFMSNAQKGTRGLYESSEKIELEKLLIGLFSDASVCTFETKEKVFDSTDDQSFIDFDRIRAGGSDSAPNIVEKGKKVSGLAGQLVIDRITLGSFKSAGATTPAKFTAKWRIDFKREGLVRPMKPILIGVNLQTVPSSPADNKVIESCLGGASLALGSCPPGNYVKGFESDGSLKCGEPMIIYQ